MDEQITAICTKAIKERVFPGCVVGYIRDGSSSVMPFGTLRYDESEPVTWETIYDVASITKSIPTASLALKLIEEGKLTLNDHVTDYIPELTNDYQDDILVRHLLTYTVIFDLPKGISGLAKDDPSSVLQTLFKSPLTDPPGTRYYYTNPPAILLGLVIERVRKETLGEAAAHLFRQLGMNSSSFVLADRDKALVAPTEIDWRGELQGNVQDEAAWALCREGRTPGNAGLFTTASDLTIFAHMLLENGSYKGVEYFKPETIELMHTNQLAKLDATCGLGWEMTMPVIMGSYCHSDTFGKTGFSGCNIVIDPSRKRSLVLLSNRTFPHRSTTRDAINNVRRALADVVLKP